MSNIRVGYTGSIAFLIGIIRLFLGFAFITVVTRTLAPEEFGTWQLIGGLLVYVLILHSIETYWLTRETARNSESAKTAIFSGGIFSTIGIGAYLLIIFLISNNSDVNFNILLYGVILVPINFFYSILSSINYGWKPQTQSYGLLIIDIVKIPTVLIFLSYYEMGVDGVILSAFLGSFASTILHLFFARSRLKSNLNFNFCKKWLKLSWLTLYPPIAGLIFSLDVTVFTIIIGTTEGLGYYGAAVIIGSLVSYGGLTFTAIYPKLLGANDTSFLRKSVTRLLYFLIPLSVIVIVFAKPGLYVLNPVYVIIYPAVILLGLRFFAFTIFDTCNYILRGIEKVDIDSTSTFKQYLKSKLFFIPTLQIIQQSVYTSSLVIFLVINSSMEITELIYYWALISLCTQIPFTIYLCLVVRKIMSFTIEWTKISKYLGASLIFGLIGYLSTNFINYELELFDFLPNLIFFISIAVSGYVVLTYVIDKESRLFIKSIFNELKSK